MAPMTFLWQIPKIPECADKTNSSMRSKFGEQDTIFMWTKFIYRKALVRGINKLQLNSFNFKERPGKLEQISIDYN